MKRPLATYIQNADRRSRCQRRAVRQSTHRIPSGLNAIGDSNEAREHEARYFIIGFPRRKRLFRIGLYEGRVPCFQFICKCVWVSAIQHFCGNVCLPHSSQYTSMPVPADSVGAVEGRLPLVDLGAAMCAGTWLGHGFRLTEATAKFHHDFFCFVCLCSGELNSTRMCLSTANVGPCP